MKWTIAFDSGCDLRNFQSPPTAELELVPLKILLGGREVVDDGSTSLLQLQAMLDSKTGKTGTACPSVGDWHAAMEGRDNVIAITISGAVSGSYQAACAARDMILEEEPDRNIFVMNSRSGSGTMQMLLDKALELIDAGADFHQVCRSLEEFRECSQIFFLLKNVDNVMSNGRLNPIIGRAVKALKMCLLATVTKEGSMDVIAKVCSFGKTMDKAVAQCVSRGCSPKKAIITHCLNEEGAEQLKEKFITQFPGVEVEICQTGLLCGYYAEKGGLILAVQS